MASVSIPTTALVAAAGSDAAAAGTAAVVDATTTAALTAAASSASLATAGAAGSIFTLGNAAAAATVLGTGLSAYSSHIQGVATANEDKRKARVEAQSEQQKQITMRQNMLRALATQNAQAGIGGGNLNKAGALRQIDEAQNDLAVSQANESAQVSLLDQNASNAVASGNVGAGGAVLSGASKLGGFG